MAIRIIIDKEFKNLIPPLRNEEYTNLEESLLSEGCREPITLWNDTIVDGHNRYEICTRLNIPFRIVHKGFSSRAEAVSWIAGICLIAFGFASIIDGFSIWEGITFLASSIIEN